jgi:capsular exopolysaccharide synthesis family protein
MFDALRRAEEKRRQARRTEREAAAAPPPPPKVMADVPEGLIRELGILANSIDSALEGKDRRSILFASSTPGEGTSTVAANYARLLAMTREVDVLLCEANIHHPTIARWFGLPGEVGLTTFFSGKGSLSSLIQKTSLEHLDVLPVGAGDPEVIQLQQRQFLPRLLEAALERYHRVILDAPPLADFPETPPMAAMVDGTVLVVHAGRTKREVVQRALGALKQFDARILGVVLNRKKFYIPEFIYKRV